MRKKCLDGVYELARKDPRVVFIGSDLGPGTLDQFKKDLPERFFMEGVSEANIVGMAAGVASGAAMLPYTVIKEANPPEMSGTATGVVNFLNFTFSALLGPVFAGRLMEASGGASPMALEHYQAAFLPLIYGVALAIVHDHVFADRRR